MQNAKIKGVEYSTKFIRSLEKLSSDIQKKSHKKETIFRLNPFSPQLKTHKLHGVLEDYWSYSVDYHYRVVFRFVNSQEVLFFDIGPHHIYGKNK